MIYFGSRAAYSAHIGHVIISFTVLNNPRDRRTEVIIYQLVIEDLQPLDRRLSVIATIILQEMSARLELVSQEGLGEALRNEFDHPVAK